MPEIKKNRIIIASVLKPVDDTRMAEKIGQTLAENLPADVHIFGYPSNASLSSNLIVYASKAFSRISIARLLQPWRLLFKIRSLKPDVVIITTHELLGMTFLLKLARRKTKFIYDVQENYKLNILHTYVFPKILRPFVASYVRLKEIIFAPVMDHFLLAEKTYKNELPFISNRATVVENKVKKHNATHSRNDRKDGLTQLLFTGTLANTTGVNTAITLSKMLYKIDNTIRLKIVGYCALSSFLAELKNEIKHHDFITLVGGHALVPHTHILDEIQYADFGIITNIPDDATQNRIPTKLYEYLGYQLPMLLTNHKPWVACCSPYNACIHFDFDTADIPGILHRMKTSKFYTSTPENVLWESEALKLTNLFKILLK